MSAYDLDVTGPWSEDASWSGTGVPTIGDTINSIAASRTVTVDSNVTVGDSPGTDTAVVTVGPGTISIADGVEFKVRGRLNYLTDGVVTYPGGGAGGMLRLDNIPDGVTYSHRIGSANSNTSAKLVIVGNASTPFTLDYSPAGTTGVGATVVTNTGGGLVQVQYANVTLGSSAVNIAYWSFNAGGWNYFWKNCTFTSCGQLRDTGSFTANGKWNLLDNKHVTTAGSNCVRAGGSTSVGTGERNVLRCDFDKTVEGVGDTWTFEDNLLRDSYLTLGSYSAPWTSFARGVLVHDNMTDQNAYGGLTDVYYVNTGSGTNLHAVTPQANVTAALTYDGVIYDVSSDVNNSGDLILLTNSSTATRAWTIQNCLVLPRRKGSGAALTTGPGVLVSAQGPASGLTVNIYHNTVCAAGGAGATSVLSIGETTAGYAGMIPEVKSNLAWSGVDSVVVGDNGSPADDMITDADYNCGYDTGGAAAYAANYAASIAAAFAATPGTNDTNVDPQFVDPLRNIITWGEAEGLGTDQSVNTILDHIWANGVVAKCAELRAWVRGGFAPQNADLKDNGHDSVTIGAVEFAATGYGPLMAHTRNRLIRAA